MLKQIMWFEEGFDQKIKQFIDNNPLPYADLNSFEMSHRYAERFITAGIPVVLARVSIWVMSGVVTARSNKCP